MAAGGADRAATVDCGAVYARLRADFSGIVLSCSLDQQQQVVPATPAWRVRDVLAHVVGITADLNRGQFGADRTVEDWTADQVAARAARSVEDLVAEWETESPAFEDGLRLFGYEVGSHFVGDLTVHVQDVDAALGRPPTPDLPTVLVALDHYLDVLDEGLADVGRLTLCLTAPGVEEERVVGAGPATARLASPARELLRVLAGRRTVAQALALDWAGDPTPFVGHLGAYGMPAEDLGDGIAEG